MTASLETTLLVEYDSKITADYTDSWIKDWYRRWREAGLEPDRLTPWRERDELTQGVIETSCQ